MARRHAADVAASRIPARVVAVADPSAEVRAEIHKIAADARDPAPPGGRVGDPCGAGLVPHLFKWLRRY